VPVSLSLSLSTAPAPLSSLHRAAAAILPRRQ
jgi:hypothetical protein